MYLSTGSEERSKSDSHRPHFRLLCCLQFDWFVDYGKICKCTALILNLKWHLQADVGSVCYCHQIVQIGAKFMLVMGLFVSSVCTILFGWAKTNCLDCLISFSSNVNFFFFFLIGCRLLNRVPAGAAFITLCFIVRSIDAVGFAAAMTSSFAMTAKIFPNNVATVLVSPDELCTGNVAGHREKNCIIVILSVPLLEPN